jgi:hypothetical protein
MVAVAAYASNGTAAGRRVHFWCPGCDEAHGVTVEAPDGWGFNGDLERPTFTPSVLVTGVQWAPEHGFHKPKHTVAPGERVVCHSYVTAGQIQFLGDCTHTLADQTVNLPPWPYGEDES